MLRYLLKTKIRWKGKCWHDAPNLSHGTEKLEVKALIVGTEENYHPFWLEGTSLRMKSMRVTWELTQPRWSARSLRETHNWRGWWASQGSQSTGSPISRLQSCGTGNKRDSTTWWIYQSYQFAAGSKNRRLIRLLFSISSLFHSQDTFNHTDMSAVKKGGREKVKTLTQFHGGNMKREEEAENLWMKDFWNRIETVQNVWKRKAVQATIG